MHSNQKLVAALCDLADELASTYPSQDGFALLKGVLRVHGALGLFAAPFSRQRSWVVFADNIVQVTEFGQQRIKAPALTE